jgi:uncharacterized membrane protein YuzA (DUF378 family)
METSEVTTPEVNHFLAVAYALIGLCVRVSWYYFQFDNDNESFNGKKFWMIYDKYIILGFAGAVALALLSDMAWPMCDSWIGMEGQPFDERLNIIIGFLAVLLLMFFDRNAKKKFDETNKGQA